MMRHMVLILAFISASAAAQNCPQGIPSGGNPFCLPPSHPSSPYYQGRAAPASPQTDFKWQTRWGAIALDTASGSVGFAVGWILESTAGQVALKDCMAKGGGKCAVEFSFSNQCAAVVMGNEKYNIQAAATTEMAAQLGMDTCNEADTNCRVYRADCSPPQRVY